MKILYTLPFMLCFYTAAYTQDMITASLGAEPQERVAGANIQDDAVSRTFNGKFEKKSGRIGFNFGVSIQWLEEETHFGEDHYDIGSIMVYYERFNMFGLAHEDAGVGFNLSYVDGFYYDIFDESTNWTETFMLKKLYFSTYFFRDFDLGRVITVGVKGGPSIVTNFLKADQDTPAAKYEGVATSFGVGLHTGQYILKYIGGGNKKKFCLRLGFEQFFSVNSGYTGLFGAGLGF